MNDETPWSHLQRLFAERKRFEDALPGLQAHGLSGEDLGVLMNNPASDLYRWMRLGAGDDAVELEPVGPPEGAGLPPRRTGKRGLMGWLSGAPAVGRPRPLHRLRQLRAAGRGLRGPARAAAAGGLR